MDRHREEKSEFVMTSDEAQRFRAVCSCGWKSEPIDASEVVIAWESHVEELRRS